MARQRKNFDSPGFIEAVRQRSVPSYHTAGDSSTATQAQPPPEETLPNENLDKSKKCDTQVSDLSRKSLVEQGQDLIGNLPDLNLSETELDFIKSYVANSRCGQVSRKGKPIVIRESFRRMICDIFNLFGESPNMAQYIDNVLSEHFRQYYPIIQGIYRKCPPKF